MERSKRTEKDIAALIDIAWGENRPNPYQFITDLHSLEDLFWDMPGVACLAHLWLNVDSAPDWTPDKADLLEDYLYGELGEDGAALRLEELRRGAPLNPGEEERYETDYWEWPVYLDCPIYYILRFGVSISSESLDQQERVAYFVGEYHEMGQHSSLNDAAGPFRSLEEVVAALTDDDRSTFAICHHRGYVECEAWKDSGVEGKRLNDLLATAHHATTVTDRTGE
jgi:hypothetical protein